MQKKNVMEKAISQILDHISKLYDSYQQKAISMSQDTRKKMGAQIDKQQKKFMQQITRLQSKMIGLLGDMDKSPAMKKPQLRQNPHIMKQCLQDIQSIIKKKNLLFKVNRVLQQLIIRTNQIVDQVKKQLAIAGQTKFLCCGVDGIQKFKQTMMNFKLCSNQWALLARLEPKDSVETFISPKYSAADYAIVRNVLTRLWPQQTVREVIKQVVKQVNTGKPSKLIQANQYIYGINRQQNPSYGLKIYHQEAQKNDAAAASYLGQVYEQGVLLPKDLKKSAKYYQKAMNGKQSYSFYRFAMALIKGQLKDKFVNAQDLQAGFKLLNQVSSQNASPQALVQLGQFYEKGRFESDKQGLFTVPIDLKRAIDYYMKARALRVPRASNNLGVLYINNKLLSESNPNSNINTEDNVYNNIQKGMKFLQQALRDGFPQAYYNLGCIHQSGVLGRKNQQEALLYYYKGGLKGDIQSRLKFAYQLMNQTSIMKQHYQDHYKIAYRWLDSIIHKIDILEQNTPNSSQLKLTKQQNPQQKAQALYYMGLMHEYGFGMDKSPKKAFNYFCQASDLGFAPAKNKVGDCYFSGFGVKQDRRTAIGCYLQAADLNNSDALVNLGTIYLNGIPGIIQQNFNQAYKCFVKASNDQNSNAMIHLSYMYKSGLGIEKDNQLAKKLLEQSAANKNPTALYMLKQFGGQFDEKVLFNNLDNQAFMAPKRINLREVVPYISDVKM